MRELHGVILASPNLSHFKGKALIFDKFHVGLLKHLPPLIDESSNADLEFLQGQGFLVDTCRFANYLAYILLIIWHTFACGRAFRHTASVA